MDVSETISDGRKAGPAADDLTAARGRGSRARGRWVALGVVAMVAAGGVSVWRAGAFSPAASPQAGGQGAAPPATATVTRQDIAAVTPVTATLGYAGSYAVTGQGGGTLTWLPSAGQVIRQGQVLYKTDNGSPVVLLYGSVPDWRSLYEGMTGQDVSQLNHDLVGLGYADRSDVVLLGWDYYSWATAYAVQLLEGHLGVSWPPGSLSLGQVVFEPEALRVSQLTGSLGGPATGPVLAGTSDREVVTIPLDASDQSEVTAGDRVTVTLPDGATTPGVVSSVGTVATSTSGSDSGAGPATTIPVQVTLTDPAAAGTLDQAPVTVNITTATAKNALAVPVSALLAQSSGEYDVEVAGPGTTRRYVPVSVGIFDDADGLVQVTGALAPGEQVVVAAS
jgi:multidrug efflux pump subunit AcrA (membrane-fusion protein)